ncbi:MAG: carbamate kinase [Halanaeroarchaeum sp.]
MGRVIVALGGNTLLPMGEASMDDQRRRVRESAAAIATIADDGTDLVVTHGNGPQVGHLLLQQEQSTDGPRYPLDVLVAETQAQIGYVLQQELGNVLGETPATVVTQVRVDEHDEAFEHPRKPIGPHYTAEEAHSFPFQTRQVRTADGRTRYRRVVPSPEPREVIEVERIRSLVADGTPVICAGGGGVPVVREGGELAGVEAVVDKDLASALLGTELDASTLVILTDVAAAYVDFGTADASPIRETTPSALRSRLEAGEFGEGSMKPKIEAAIDFVEGRGERAIVTDTDHLEAALAGEAGTRVHPD